MKLYFFGTCGSHEARNSRHARHSALQLSSAEGRLWLDCGRDWLEQVPTLQADAIVLTHAHADHAFGLKNGAPCPVYATAETWEGLADCAVTQRRLLRPGHRERLAGFSFEPIPLFHSLRAPAVALRISRQSRALLYAPDIAALADPARDLAGIDLYIGDGSAFDDSLWRLEGEQPCGHAPMERQLDWCATAGVRQVLFTHCGEEIVADNETELQNRVRDLGQARNLKAAIAWDGLEWQLE